MKLVESPRPHVMNDRDLASSIQSEGSLAPPPTSGGFAPPPPPTASYTPRRLPTTAAEVLDEMTEVIPGARGALLASVDGFALARSDSMPNEAAHAAMISAAVGLAHQLVSMGNGTELRQLVVDHDEGLLLLWPVGTDRVLAMLTVSSVDQSRLRGFVRARARLLAEDLR